LHSKQYSDRTSELISPLRYPPPDKSCRLAFLSKPESLIICAQSLSNRDPFALADEANSQIYTYVGEAKKRKITADPAYFTDERDRKVYVLQIGIDGRRSPFAVLYD